MTQAKERSQGGRGAALSMMERAAAIHAPDISVPLASCRTNALRRICLIVTALNGAAYGFPLRVLSPLSTVMASECR